MVKSHTVIMETKTHDNKQSSVFPSRVNVCLPDEAGNVDINKCGHEVLAVESVHNATVTRDSVGKILKGQRTGHVLGQLLKRLTDINRCNLSSFANTQNIL